MAHLWWISLILKLILVSFVPLTADENYYWVWSQKLSLSYFDHPPMVAWLFKVGSFFPEFMIKWPAVCLGHMAFWFWYLFLKSSGFSEGQCRIWFWVSIGAPLIGLSTLVLTPDLPLLLFYSLTIYFFDRALVKKSWYEYALFGLSFGLGFTSKYHIVLILPSLLIYLIASRQIKNVKWNFVLISLLFVLIGAFPVLWWNYQNEWISFKFQLNHGLGKKSWKPKWPWEYLGSVLMLLLPFYWGTFYKAVRENKQKLLIYLSVPILVFFFVTSFRSKVEANWSQIAFFPALSLLAYHDLSRWKSKVTVLFWSLSLMVLLFLWSKPWYKGCPEKFCEPNRYLVLKEVVDEHQPFMASNYQMASYLWFQTKAPFYKLYDMSRTDFYDTLPEAHPAWDEFYLAKDPDTDLPSWLPVKGYKTELVKWVDEELQLLRVYK